MSRLIDKDVLVKWIRSRLHPTVVPYGTNYDDWDKGADNERLNILSFIDTLEVKDIDLDKEIDSVEDSYHGFESLSRADVIDIAKYFFELGFKTQKGE